MKAYVLHRGECVHLSKLSSEGELLSSPGTLAQLVCTCSVVLVQTHNHVAGMFCGWCFG